MLLNFPKIFRGDQTPDSGLSKKDVVEATPLEQKAEQLSLVTEGRVTIDFTSISPSDGALLVGFFVSNGYNQKVKFGNVPLVLLDSDRQVLAQQTFSGETIGEVLGGSTKACVVRFLPDNIYSRDVPADCQVCFDVRPKRFQNIQIQYQALPEGITVNKRQELEQILTKLPPMKYGEVNFSPLWAKITPQNQLLATVIIRNSTNQPINFNQIPLVILDAHQEELARGLFDITSIAIEPFKAILWTFNFENVSQDRDVDLSSWQINVLK